jgi:hypothetical protein
MQDSAIVETSLLVVLLMVAALVILGVFIPHR